MSLLAARNRHFSGSALHATLHQPDLRHHKAKETIPLVKRNRKSHHFSDLCSLSMQFRVKRKKTKERKKSKKKGISDDETRRRRGLPRKIRNPSDRVIYKEKVVCSGEASAYAAVSERARPRSVDKTGRDGALGIFMGSGSGKRKRVRTRVDLSALGSYANGVEMRRFTVGLLGFLEQVNWWILGRGRKLVILAPRMETYSMHQKPMAGLLQILKFATCNEVSTCQHSRLESQRLNSLQSDNKTLGKPVGKQNLESERGSSEVF